MLKKLGISLLWGLLVLSPLVAQQIRVPGLGNVTLRPLEGDEYQFDLGSFGTYRVRGTVDPLDLGARLELEDLRALPGYTILSRLGFHDIELALNREEGYRVRARMDITQGPLAHALESLSLTQIVDPLVEVNMSLSLEGLSLEGTLRLREPDYMVEIIPSLGTQFVYEDLSFGFTVELDLDSDDMALNLSDIQAEGIKGLMDIEPTVNLISNMRIRPTRHDPFLELQTVYAFNIMTLELIGRGSLLNNWNNPLGLGNYVEGDSVLVGIGNASMEIGWIPGTPSPSRLGVYSDEATVLGITTGIAVDFTPTMGRVALMARIDSLSPSQLMTVFNDLLGLGVPNFLPSHLALRNVEVLFAPFGGEVGDHELEQGLRVGGEIQYTRGNSSSLVFGLDQNREFGLSSEIHVAVEEILGPLLSRNAQTRAAMNQINIREIGLHLGGRPGRITGGVSAQATVLGRNHQWDLGGSLDATEIAQNLYGRVQGLVREELTRTAQVISRNVVRVARDARSVASRALSRARDLARQTATAMNHARHSFNTCYNTCVPRYANSQADPLLGGSNDAVQQFVNQMRPDLANYRGSRQERARLIQSEWDQMVREIDRHWEEILGDRLVIRFFTLSRSATRGRQRYQEIIRQKWDEHRQHRQRLWNSLLGA